MTAKRLIIVTCIRLSITTITVWVPDLVDLFNKWYAPLTAGGENNPVNHETGDIKLHRTLFCMCLVNVFIIMFIYTNKTGDCLSVCLSVYLSVRLWAAKPHGLTG